MIDSVSNEGSGGQADLKKARRDRAAVAVGNIDRLPPHSNEAERGLLGCMMLNPPDVLDECAAAGVTAEWFYDLRHQLIFHRAAAMHRARVPVEVLSLTQQLMDEGNLEQVGGMAYIADLQDATPSAAGVAYFTETVRSKYLLRQAIRKCLDAVNGVYAHDGAADELLHKLALDFATLTETAERKKSWCHIRDAVARVVEDMEEHYTRGHLNLPPGYLSTGFEYCDKVMGGIGPEELVILAGRPGAGKTTLAMDMVWNLSTSVKWTEKNGVDENGKTVWKVNEGQLPIGVFSLEMSDKSLARRLMFRHAQVSAGKFKQGFATGDDVQKLTQAAAAVAGKNIILDASGGQSIGQIAATARQWVKNFGVKLFVLDYLQLVKTDRRMENRNRELEEIVNQIVVLKKALQVPWLVLTQMNRDIEKAESHRVPQLADLKDCGAIEQACDHAFFLYLPERGKTRIDRNGEEKPDKRRMEDDFIDEHFAEIEATERPRRVNGFEAKNRDGATGVVEFLFHRNQFRFEDWRQFARVNGFVDYGKGERRGHDQRQSKIDAEDTP